MRRGLQPAPQGPHGEDEFRALAETAPDAIVVAGIGDRIVFANAAALELFGRPAHALVGRPVTTIVPERFRQAHHAAFTRYCAGGPATLVGRTIEVPALHADGHEFPIELSLGTVGSGASRRLTAIIRDLSARKRRERHLAAQLAVTNVLAGRPSAQSTPELIVEALTRSLGWDCGALWVHDEDGLVHLRSVWQADPEATGELVRRAQEAPPAPSHGLVGRTMTTRSPVWIDDLAARGSPFALPDAVAAGMHGVIGLPLVVADRPLGAFVCFTRDQLRTDAELRDLLMTVASQVGEHIQRLEAEEQLEALRARHADELERSNRELEHFAHVAAHDLRGPLRTVTGLGQVLGRRHREALDADGRELVEMIVANAQRGGRLLESLLAYAQAGADAPADEVDGAELLAEVLAALLVEVEARNARVSAGRLPAVRANRVQAGQILQNLIANAIKYTPPERTPEVRVEAERQGPMVAISVTDNGIGIPPEDADALFEMFARGPGEDDFEGTGIGLAVCARLVARHGGRIFVEPVRSGGSRFTFTLPAA